MGKKKITAGKALLITGAGIGLLSGYLYQLAFAAKPMLAFKFPEKVDPLMEKRNRLEKETEKWLMKQNPEHWQISSVDGLKLHAQFLPAAIPTKKTILCVHGWHGRPAGDFAGLIQFYHQAGYNVLLPDNRGHGFSEGRVVGFGWQDKDDLYRWCRRVAEKTGKGTIIALHGVSMGAAAVLMTAGQCQEQHIRCVIEDCGFTSVYDQLAHQLIGVPKFLKGALLFPVSLWVQKINGYRLKEASALESARVLQYPLLVIHGEKDNFVPTRMGVDIYLAATGVKELYTVKKAGHAVSYMADRAQYEKTVGKFLEKYLQ